MLQIIILNLESESRLQRDILKSDVRPRNIEIVTMDLLTEWSMMNEVFTRVIIDHIGDFVLSDHLFSSFSSLVLVCSFWFVRFFSSFLFLV